MAREFIGNGSVAVNGLRIDDATAVFDSFDAMFGRYLVLRRGKKLFHMAIFDSIKQK
jgi:tyrosyl-tRNA synthetase